MRLEFDSGNTIRIFLSEKNLKALNEKKSETIIRGEGPFLFVLHVETDEEHYKSIR